MFLNALEKVNRNLKDEKYLIRNIDDTLKSKRKQLAKEYSKANFNHD